MKKIIISIIIFFLSALSIAQFQPIFAQDYDQYCTPGVCWPQNGGNAVFYDGCTDDWGYCAGTGNVSPGYCSCRVGGTGYAGGCSCDLNYNRNGDDGPACTNVPNTWGVCRLAPAGYGGLTCTSDATCRTYDGGEYPTDDCIINSSLNCKIAEIPWIIGCCYASSTDPTPTSMVIPTLGPTTATPTPTPPPSIMPTLPPPTDSPYYQVTINVHFVKSSSASLSGGVCTGAASPLYNTAITSNPAVNLNWGIGNYVDPDGGAYSFDLNGVEAGDTFNLQAWPQDNNFGCSCSSSPVPGFENNCYYANVEVPPKANPTLDLYIYFDQANQPESWFQTFGASAFARNNLTSIVPFTTCEAKTGECQPAVFAPRPTLTSGLSSGFALLGTNSYLQLLTDENDGPATRFQNIHWTGKRNLNQDAFGLGLNADNYSLGYDYFYGLADNGSTIRPVTAAQANLATWRSNDGWISGGNITDYFLINESLTLDQNNGFQVASGESIVVFINGNLTINNNGGSDNTKITTVARKTSTNSGGFLAFITNGNITISSNVGKTIDPDQTSFIQAVTYANTHLEGVFVADGTITINGQDDDDLNGGYPDRKLIVAGTFVGLTDIDLNRRADDPADPTTIYYKIQNSFQAFENFVYRADLLINWPEELKSSIINWQEVAPRSFN